MNVLRRPTFCFTWVLLLFFLSGATPGRAQSDQRTITVVGQTYSKDQDAAAARQQAIADALTTAVDLAAVDMLGSDEAVARFADLGRIILGNEKDFIQTYEVMTGGATIGNRFRILVKATVSLDRIRERLASLDAPPEPEPGEQTGGPRLLLFVAEQQTERGPVHYWWREAERTAAIVSDAAMVRILSDAGFTVIPHEALFQDPEMVARVRFNPYIEPGDAAVAGRELEAGVVIVGTAVARRSLDIMGEETRTFSATVSVRAFAADTAAEIADVTRTSAGSGVNDAAGRRAALEKAGEACGRELAGELAAVLSRPAGGDGLRVIVGGTRNLGIFVAFRRELLDMAGVSGIRLQEMRTNEAVLRVDYDGDGDGLARALADRRFETFTLKLYEAEPQEVRLELVAP